MDEYTFAPKAYESKVSLNTYWGLSWWFSGKESASQCRRCGLIPGLVRPSGGGNGNPLQYSCLENPMDRGPWLATVHRVAKDSDTAERLNNKNTHWIHNTRPPLKCLANSMLVLEKDSSTSSDWCYWLPPGWAERFCSSLSSLRKHVRIAESASHPKSVGSLWVGPTSLSLSEAPSDFIAQWSCVFMWEIGESGQWLAQSCCYPDVDGKQYLHNLL